MTASSSSSSSIASTGPSIPSSSSGTTDTTRVACYTNSLVKAAATYVDFPTFLLTTERSVAPLPDKDAILKASPNSKAFLHYYYNDNPEMDKLETLGNANCHMTIYAWHVFAQLPDEEKSDVKSQIVTKSMRRISTNPTYLANSLIAYSAMVCRAGSCITHIPPYCFHRVPKPLMGCSSLLELLLQRLEVLLVEKEKAKVDASSDKNKAQLLQKLNRWKLTGPDVLKEATRVLTENPLVQEIHNLRIENKVLEYDISIRQTDKQESDDTAPSNEEEPEAEVEEDDGDAEEKDDDAESSEEELDVSDRGRRRTKRNGVKAKPATPKRTEHWATYESLQTTEENKKLVSQYNRLCREESFDCISYKRCDGVTVPEIVWKNGDRMEVAESIMECLGWSDALWLSASQPPISPTSVNNHGNRSNGNGLQNGHNHGEIVLKPSDEFFAQVQKYIEKLKNEKAKKQGAEPTPQQNKRDAKDTSGKEEATEKNKPNLASTNGKEKVTETPKKKQNRANTNGEEEMMELQPNRTKPNAKSTNGKQVVVQTPPPKNKAASTKGNEAVTTAQPKNKSNAESENGKKEVTETPKQNKPNADSTNGKESVVETQPSRKRLAESTNGKEEETKRSKTAVPNVASANGRETQPNKNKPKVASTNG